MAMFNDAVEVAVVAAVFVVREVVPETAFGELFD